MDTWHEIKDTVLVPINFRGFLLLLSFSSISQIDLCLLEPSSHYRSSRSYHLHAIAVVWPSNTNTNAKQPLFALAIRQGGGGHKDCIYGTSCELTLHVSEQAQMLFIAHNTKVPSMVIATATKADCCE